MRYEFYKTLPDSMGATEILKHFKFVLQQPIPTNTAEKIETFKVLYELADRQWHTYEVLESETRNLMDRFICKLWNPDIEEIIGLTIAIVGNLGLRASYEQIKNSINDSIQSEVRTKLKNAFKELKEPIEDPYKMA